MTFTDASCGLSWPSTDSSHAQIVQVAPGLWQVGFDDAGAGCASSDHDFNDLIVDISSQSISAAESLGQGGSLQNDTHCRTGDPVDCATGNFTHTFSDLSVAGRGVPLALMRTYNSLAASTTGMFGYGWSCSYCMSLSLDSGGTATVTQGDGATSTFSPNGTGGFLTAPRVLGSLVANVGGTHTLTVRGRLRYTFSSTGVLMSEADPNGYTTTLVYNGSGQLTTVTDPAGRALGFSYGTNGLVSSVTDPASRVVSYGYDSGANLTSVSDVGTGLTGFGYDANHLVVTMSDPRSGGLVNTYDGSARVTKQVDPAGWTMLWSYGSGSTTITDPKGQVSVQTYTDGMLTKVIKGFGTPSAATWTYGYDQSLGVSSRTDPNVHTLRAGYDLNGNLTLVTDPLLRTTKSSYNGFGEPTSVTDANSVTTTSSYDGAGNLTSTSTPLLGSSPAQNKVTSYGHGDAVHPGDVTSVTDPDLHVSLYGYTTNGDLASASNAAAEKTTYGYNTIGWRTSMVTPAGQRDRR